MEYRRFSVPVRNLYGLDPDPFESSPHLRIPRCFLILSSDLRRDFLIGLFIPSSATSMFFYAFIISYADIDVGFKNV